MKLLFTFLFITISSGAIFGQSSYSQLTCEGPIPESFLRSNEEKYLEDKSKAIKSERKKQNSYRDEFFEKSTFKVNELFYSGSVLFGDEVTEYLRTIKDYLLRDYPNLQKQVEIYTIRSPGVNAFAVGSGEIFINIGLLAHLQNEAQLAFIICHEIQHVLENHSIDTYLYNRNLASKNNVRKGLTLNQFLSKASKFSRSQEMDADLKGLELFNRSQYDPHEVETLFKIFSFSAYPWDTIVPSSDFLGELNSPIPDSLFHGEDNYFDARIDSNRFSSHPDLQTRIEALSAIMDKDLLENDKSTFIFGRDNFLRIREICRREMSEILIQEGEYISAIFNSYLLEKGGLEVEMLTQIRGRSLYALSRYFSEDRKDEVIKGKGEAIGYTPHLTNFFRKLSKEELNLLALTYNWKVRNNQNDSTGISYRLNRLVSDLINSDLEFGNCGEKISETDSLSPYFKGLANNLWKDTEFCNLVRKIESLPKPNEVLLEEKEVKEKIKEEKLRGFALGLESVVFVNPEYRVVNTTKKNPIRYVEAEQKQKKLEKIILENSEEVGIKASIISKNQFSSKSTEEYNDLTLLNRWLIETFERGDVLGPAHIDDQVKSKLIEKYGTSHFVWYGINEETWKSPIRYFALYGVAFIWVVAPLALYIAFEKDHDAVFYYLVMDLEKGRPDHFDVQFLSKAPRPDFQHSLIYYSLLQMKRK